MFKNNQKTLIFLIFLLTVTSCSYQKVSRNQVAKNINVPIFIQIPENKLVFEDVSSHLYKALYKTYKSFGYKLSDNYDDAFVLNTKVKRLDPVEKFISPDLLLYNIRVGLEVSCRLLDKDQRMVAEHLFKSYRLVSFPQDPILNSEYLDFEYKKIMDRISFKIERYFRRYLLKV